MKDRVSNDIGMEEPLENWNSIDWKQVKRKVRNLRQRIYRATQKNQWKKVRNLMKLMLRSYSNLLLSVRKVTQENQGRRTAGIDGYTATTPNERVKLVRQMKEHALWKVHPTKRIYIPKANGKLRPLGIATIRDRVAQTMVKNALEPSWEARFEENSYGFRPGRSCQDAIDQSFIRLRKGCDLWILDADIKGAFDNINHEYILKVIGKLPGRELIKQWLKAGYVETNMFHETDKGTAQGGSISPLLANIALDGMENLLAQYKKVKDYQIERKSGKGTERTTIKKVKSNKYGFIRYADDYLVTAQTKEDIEVIIPILKEWLTERGLELNGEKTNITHVNEGTNFLGFNIRQYKGTLLIKPQKEKTLAFLRNIQKWLNNNRSAKPEDVIAYLNPVIRGWGNYYRYVVSKEVFFYVDNRIWEMLWRWAKRRHPNKGRKWIAKKYFDRPHSWGFRAITSDRNGFMKKMTLFRVSSIPIERHVKVKGKSSPDDPNLKQYWEKRRTSQGKSYWQKGSKLYKVAVNQEWKCPVCGEHLFNGEELHTHHKIRIKDGGGNEEFNLVHLHKTCHRHLHTGKLLSARGLSRIIENG